MNKENWYILRTYKDQEYEAADLLEQAIPKSLCSLCRIPQKIKMFRRGGEFHLVKDIMFPGYLFVRTSQPEKLQKVLKKSREFPQFLLFGKTETGEDELIPISTQDLTFLQNVCGNELQSDMGVTDITLGENRTILGACGALERYVNQIVRLDLHKRFAVVAVPLFNHSQTVQFGIRLEQDRDIVA